MEDYMNIFDSIITAATLMGYKINYLDNRDTRIYDFIDTYNSLKITIWLVFNDESLLYKIVTINHRTLERLEITSKYNDLFKEVLKWI
ncbi:hypothetical protein D3C75_529350 [compost metagenome]